MVSTYSDPDGILYLNGQEVGSSSTSVTDLDDINVIGFGNIPGNPNGDFEGEIAINAIYNRGLTADEVLQNFIAIKGRYGI